MGMTDALLELFPYEMPLLPLNLLMTSNSRIDLLQYITSVSSGRRQHYNLLNVSPFRLAVGNSCLILTEL